MLSFGYPKSEEKDKVFPRKRDKQFVPRSSVCLYVYVCMCNKKFFIYIRSIQKEFLISQVEPKVAKKVKI